MNNFFKNFIFTMAIILSFSSCAKNDDNLAVSHDDNDPFEPYNRFMFDTNNYAYNVALDPITYAYRAGTPTGFRMAVRNFFSNLGEPLNAVNSLLQGNIAGTGDNIFRFIVNSTYGMAGIGDVASDFGLEDNNQDFGKTLASWGVSEGPYVVLPLLGGYNLRDAFGIAGDYFAGPFTWILWDEDDSWAYTGIPNIIATNEQYIDLRKGIETSSLDYYSSMRETLRQNRKSNVNKNLGIEDNSLYDFNFEEE